MISGLVLFLVGILFSVIFDRKKGVAFLFTSLSFTVITYLSKSIALIYINLGQSAIILDIVILLLLMTITFGAVMTVSIMKNDYPPTILQMSVSLIICFLNFMCLNVYTVILLLINDSNFLFPGPLHISDEMSVQISARRDFYTRMSSDCYRGIIDRFPTVLNYASFNINSLPNNLKEDLRGELRKLCYYEDMRREAVKTMEFAGLRARYQKNQANALLEGLNFRWV